MRTVSINDKTYTIPDVTFDTICELEENGVYLLNFDKDNRKIATMIRALTAWVMQVDVATASAEISEHIAKGYDLMDIMTAVTEAITDSGFFGQKPKKAQQNGPQNREQRRHPQKNTTH